MYNEKSEAKRKGKKKDYSFPILQNGFFFFFSP